MESYIGPDKDIAFDPNASLARLLDTVDSLTPSEAVVYTHPKFVALEKIVQQHFDQFQESTRVIVFCKVIKKD